MKQKVLTHLLCVMLGFLMFSLVAPSPVDNKELTLYKKISVYSTVVDSYQSELIEEYATRLMNNPKDWAEVIELPINDSINKYDTKLDSIYNVLSQYNENRRQK